MKKLLHNIAILSIKNMVSLTDIMITSYSSGFNQAVVTKVNL